MKRRFLFIASLLLIVLLASCKKSTINQKEVYQKIQDLCDGYKSDNITFTSVLTNEEVNIVLTNTGSLVKKDDSYTYQYSYQYLNEIGSGAEELISTLTGLISGTATEIMDTGFSVSNDYKVVSLDIANSFKTYKIEEENESYIMKGYLTRNTIIKNTDNLDSDIRFNYELYTNKDVTIIEKLIISYVTVRFDSVVVTITF